MKIILIFTILFNAFEAIYEALYDNGKKVASKLIEDFMKIWVVTICLFYLSGYRFLLYELIPMWKVFVGFVFIRFAIFDIVWNLSRGVQWNYYGQGWYDKFMTKLGGWGWFVKFICGIVGFCFLMGWS